MRILVVTQYFWPEDFRVNDLTAQLSAAGHEVTVLTGLPNYPKGKLFPGYQDRWAPFREEHNGTHVIRMPLIPRGSSGRIRLTLNYLSFAATASVLGPLYCRGKYDLVLACQLSPATSAIPAVVLKRLKHVPMIYWVLDLWPESLSATGAVSSGLALRIVGKMMDFLYLHCDRILISSRGFGPRIAERGFPASRIEYFPNWVEEDATEESDEPADKGSSLASLPDGFRVMFAGNIGAAQDFPTILRAAESLRSLPDLHWVVLGDGRRLDWVRSEIENRGLSSIVHLLGRQAPQTMPSYFALADAMLVTLKSSDVFSLTVPGKIQSYMAAGRPIVAALDGEGCQLVLDSGCGIACRAEDPDGLARSVLQMYRTSKEERERMGSRGKAYRAEHFARARLFEKLSAVLQEVAAPLQTS